MEKQTVLPPMSIVETLLSLPSEQRKPWLAAHQDLLDYQVVAAMKTYSDERLLSEPQVADEVSRCAILVADLLPADPLAYPLACWTRGNWEAYHNPKEAITYYERAIIHYQNMGELHSVARLCGNLVFVYTDCGRFEDAQQAYEQARAIYLVDGSGVELYWQRLEQNYGWLLQNQGCYEEALIVHERALVLAEQCNPGYVAEVRVNQALVFGMLGRLRECEEFLLTARDIAVQHGQNLNIAKIDMDLGYLAIAQGNPAYALRRLQFAQERFVALQNTMEIGAVKIEQANLFKRLGMFSEAQEHYAHAHNSFSRLAMHTFAGQTLVNWAVACRLDGEYQQAQQLLEQAQTLWVARDQPYWLSLIKLEQAALALDQHDYTGAISFMKKPLDIVDNLALNAQGQLLLGKAFAAQWYTEDNVYFQQQAEQFYNHALQFARTQGDRWMERQALAELGKLLLSSEAPLAQQYLEEAVALDELTRQALSVEELKAGFQSQSSDVLQLLVRHAIEEHQPWSALTYTWRMKGSALLDLLTSAIETRQRLPEGQEVIEQIRHQLAGERWRLARQVSEDPEHQREQQDSVIRSLETQLAQTRRKHNYTIDNSHTQLENPQLLLEQMDADVLIEYVLCEDDIFALCVTREGQCSTTHIADMTELLDILDELQLNITNVITQTVEHRARHMGEWLDECLPWLEQAYNLLIAPLEPLPEGARLLIAPCDPLYLFPFAALWNGETYLIEQQEIQITPSGALLAVPVSSSVTGGPPLVIASSAGNHLTAVQNEVDAIQKALPKSVCLVNDLQSLDTLTHLSESPRILHIAAHSLLRSDLPLLSALQLEGGMLSVEQCYDLPLQNTELVTLNGCTTATGFETGGALLAFQSAFLVAGTHNVISSLWSVDDQTAAFFMAQFYQNYADGLSPVAALRQTQLALLQNSHTNHPAIWAAFACSRPFGSYVDKQ
ncbi:MAG: CHAT domain-containing protein [Chloroflexota bacterium]